MNRVLGQINVAVQERGRLRETKAGHPQQRDDDPLTRVHLPRQQRVVLLLLQPIELGRRLDRRRLQRERRVAQPLRLLIGQEVEALEKAVEARDRLHHCPQRVRRRIPTVALPELLLPHGEEADSSSCGVISASVRSPAQATKRRSSGCHRSIVVSARWRRFR